MGLAPFSGPAVIEPHVVKIQRGESFQSHGMERMVYLSGEAA